MIRTDTLAKRFGDRVAIDGVTFSVQPGEVFGLLGPNGGGKTTTMRLIAGLLRPTAGTATVGGRSLAEDRSASHLLGFLTEQPGLYDRLSALDNLLFFARLYEVPESRVRAQSMEALDRFGLADRAADKAGNLSKGLRQRLALARAVLHHPKALLLDEPTSGLDPEAAADVRRVIAQTAADGAAVVVSTHNLAEAERLCRRVAIVKNRLFSVVDEAGTELVSVSISARELPPDAVAGLAALPTVREASLQDGTIRLTPAAREGVADAVAHLVRRGARVDAVTPVRRALEERYLQAVGAEMADADGAVG